jgi:hypothetical protein
MSLPEASYKQLYQAEVKSTYNSWTETLTLIKTVTDPTVKRMWTEDLQDIYLKAEKLMEGVSIHPPSQTYLGLILSRPLEQWITIVKHAGSVIV